MDISSVSSAYGAYTTQTQARPPEAAETRQASRKQEEEAVRAQAEQAKTQQEQAPRAQLQPTVNLNGQKVGQVINEFA